MTDAEIPIANDNMTLPYRVELIVYAWAGSKQTVPTKTGLKDVWAAAKNPVSEYPDPAANDLITKLKAQFKAGNDARDLSRMTPALFKSAGPVQTIDDLSDWVLNSPVAIAAKVAPGPAGAAPSQGLVDSLAAGADPSEGGE